MKYFGLRGSGAVVAVPAGDDLAATSFSDSQERPDVPLWDQQLCHNQLAAARLGLRREPLGRVLV